MTTPSTAHRYWVEIAVQDLDGVRVAHDNGADRVELCAALAVGGITPSEGLIEAAVAVGIPVHVLIRPRAGGFVYSPSEIDVMARDVACAVRAGAAGVVTGALIPTLAVNTAAVREFVAAADGRDVTFHRAIDVTSYPLAAIDDLADLGVRRVLTSGQAATVGSGLDALRRLAKHAGNRLEIQAGGGMTIDDIPELLRSGIRDIHLSARTRVSDSGPAVPGGEGRSSREITDPQQVKRAVAAARRAVA